MTLNKLAIELDETIRQTRQMVADLNDALTALLDSELSATQARLEATQRMLVGLQAQDRIEQRCSNINTVLYQMSKSEPAFDEAKSDEIWKSLSLDELSKPELSGVSAQVSNGDIDLF